MRLSGWALKYPHDAKLAKPPAMITCHKKYLVARCVERGYTLDSVMACVVAQNGDNWTIDEHHADYPRPRLVAKSGDVANMLTTNAAVHSRVHAKHAQGYKALSANVADWRQLQKNLGPPAGFTQSDKIKQQNVYHRSGVGTELKKLLAKIGIAATPTCSCNKRARTMDEKGIDWCKENIDLIVSWLREEAEKRRLPFVDFAGKLLVKRAISLAEKAEKKRLAEEAQENAADG